MKADSFVYFLFIFLTLSCKQEYPETPVDFSSYELVDGFHLKAVAAEPLIEAPIALDFDDKGAIWVLEMPGYMRTLEGINEDDPIGRILVLQDKDGDGQADHTKVVLDSLKLGRAFALVYDGILYAEPPFLYFADLDENYKLTNTVIVDSSYAVGGNVEHQPNGLIMNIDNWIYSAKDAKRYRLKNGKWVKEKTAFRGQWGISHDANGRLLYNDNSNQLRGDWALPNVLYSNPKYTTSLMHGKSWVTDQRVYPVQATAVNRGYLPGVLHENGMLKNFTSACGPLYLEGDSFPQDFQGDVFTCGPEVNLIKRNTLDYSVLKVTGKQAYENKEFLRSSDQAFRPVNLYNGPDGAMYVVDMHRGIIQHKTYLTSYLREKYIEKGLDSIIGMGRILRIAADTLAYQSINLRTLNNKQLIDSLGSRNIWIRDKAQQVLLTKNEKSILALLKNKFKNSTNEIEKIHLLYTMEGLNALPLEEVSMAEIIEYPDLVSHVLKLYAELKYPIHTSDLKAIMLEKNEVMDFYLIYYLATTLSENNISVLTEVFKEHQDDKNFGAALISGVYGKEDLFLNSPQTHSFIAIRDQLDSVTRLKIPQSTPFILGEDNLTKGRLLYNYNCATCHGPDGKGIENLAPPLLASELVSENKERLVALMLHGLTGPLKIAGKDYNFSNAMPGIGSNEKLSNENIRDLGNFIRNAFTTSPQSITIQTVDSLRSSGRPFDKMYTQNELNEAFP